MEQVKRDETGRHGRFSISGAFIVLGVSVVVYLLGIGPAAWLYNHTSNEVLHVTLEVIYYPLEFFLESTPLYGPLCRYVEWFVSL